MSQRTLIPGPAATPNVPARAVRPGIALAVLATCQLMVVLDMTVVNVALPSIQRGLHFSPTGLAWVLNAYTLTFGGLLLLGGRAGDILGRRRVLVAGILLFSLASLLGGLASSSGWLLAARALQGVGGAVASPTALALITTNFPEGPERTRAFGIYAAVSAGGASLGLIAGGLLTSWLSWRWALFVNLPIGIAIAVLAPRFVAESERRPGRFDLAGALASTGGMASLVYGFIRAASHGWDDGATLAAFAVAAVLLPAFLVIELRSAQPVTPLRLFADRNRSGAHLTRLLLVAGMFGQFFFVTQFVQEVLGFGPLQAGLAFLPTTVLVFASARAASRLVPRLGAKPLTVTGITVTLVGMLWLSRVSVASGYLGGVLGPMALFGLGMGLPFVTLTMAALSGVAPRDSGAAASLVNVTQQVGGSLGLAVLVTVFGTASRHAAAQQPAAGALAARAVLTHGVASALTAATVLIAAGLLAALVVIDARMGERG
jgi:EmrB/QacA subfamily drug resistance transporter